MGIGGIDGPARPCADQSQFHRITPVRWISVSFVCIFICYAVVYYNILLLYQRLFHCQQVNIDSFGMLTKKIISYIIKLFRKVFLSMKVLRNKNQQMFPVRIAKQMILFRGGYHI